MGVKKGARRPGRTADRPSQGYAGNVHKAALEAGQPASHGGEPEVFAVGLLEDAEFARLSANGSQEHDTSVDASQNNIFAPIQTIEGVLIAEDVFDELGYLRLNPDVRKAIEVGHWESGYSHYVRHGSAEGRPLPDMPREVRNTLLPTVDASPAAPAVQARCSIDALLVAPGGGLMVVGWIDDVINAISCIRIISGSWRLVMDESRFFRVRRTDVEQALGNRAQHSFGFFGFLHFDRGGQNTGLISVELWQKGGVATAVQCAATMVEDVDLRDTALSYIASASFFGNRGVEGVRCLGRGVGAELVRFNKAITRRIVATPYVERFGPPKRAPRGTIIVCLYGKPEFYFVQNCLFGGLPGVDEYEFVYVSNSPEMAEALLREAQCASLIYGLTNAVMILPGNAGFGGANNAAARISQSDRLLIVNPDVFPRDRDWAKKHTDLLDAAPREQTKLFGVPLYYDDGSLMHGGMYFDIDVGVTMAGGAPMAQQIGRVEHYGKGAPADSPQFVRPRAVPAVTGGFQCLERSWFEQLGGFTEDFIFGHYEDADLCLKSIERGVAPWLHDIRMWHLEGKGSTRKLPHEGGSLVNRWLFSQTWLHAVQAGLQGPSPSHPLMHPPSPRSSSAAVGGTRVPR